MVLRREDGGEFDLARLLPGRSEWWPSHPWPLLALEALDAISPAAAVAAAPEESEDNESIRNPFQKSIGGLAGLAGLGLAEAPLGRRPPRQSYAERPPGGEGERGGGAANC